MEKRAMTERSLTGRVPFVVQYGAIPGQGRVFDVCPPADSRNPLFWRVMDRELAFTAEGLADDPVKRGIIVPMASIAITIGEPYRNRRNGNGRLSPAEYCSLSFGKYRDDMLDVWALGLRESLRMLNGGEAMPEALEAQIVRGFYDTATGAGPALLTDPRFEDAFIQDMRKQQQSTGHLVEGLKTSLADARLLYLLNALVVSYAQALGA